MASVKTKYVIMAGGPAKRWNNYLGVRKHFCEIRGDTLLGRTLRLLKDGCASDINVVGPPEANDFYLSCGFSIMNVRFYLSRRIGPAAIYEVFDFDKNRITGFDGLWEPQGRTVVLFGDVYFTDDAMDKIMNQNHDTECGYCWFARPNKSKITGCPHREIFAISFRHWAAGKLGAILWAMLHSYNTGKLQRAGGWELYAYLEGFDPDEATKGKGYVVIDDETEDFDNEGDYKRWMKNVEGISL